MVHVRSSKLGIPGMSAFRIFWGDAKKMRVAEFLKKERVPPITSGTIRKERENNTGNCIRILVHQPMSATPDPDNP